MNTFKVVSHKGLHSGRLKALPEKLDKGGNGSGMLNPLADYKMTTMTIKQFKVTIVAIL